MINRKANLLCDPYVTDSCRHDNVPFDTHYHWERDHEKKDNASIPVGKEIVAQCTLCHQIHENHEDCGPCQDSRDGRQERLDALSEQDFAIRRGCGQQWLEAFFDFLADYAVGGNRCWNQACENEVKEGKCWQKYREFRRWNSAFTVTIFKHNHHRKKK